MVYFFNELAWIENPFWKVDLDWIKNSKKIDVSNTLTI